MWSLVFAAVSIIFILSECSAMKDCHPSCICEVNNFRKNTVTVDCSFDGKIQQFSIPQKVPENTTDVTLQRRKLYRIMKYSFKHWTASILSLDLSFCDIEHVHSNALVPLVKLEKLELKHNKIKRLANVIFPIPLEKLNLAENPLQVPFNDILIDATHLTELDLTKCDLPVNVIDMIENAKSPRIILFTCDKTEEIKYAEKDINIKCSPPDADTNNQAHTTEEANVISTTATPTRVHEEQTSEANTIKPTEWVNGQILTTDELLNRSESEGGPTIIYVTTKSNQSFIKGLVIGLIAGFFMGYLCTHFQRRYHYNAPEIPDDDRIQLNAPEQ